MKIHNVVHRTCIKDPYLSGVVFYENCQNNIFLQRYLLAKAKQETLKGSGRKETVAAMKSVCCNAAFCDLTPLPDRLIHGL